MGILEWLGLKQARDKPKNEYEGQDFLSMNREEYKRFLKHIVEVIKNRNSKLVSNQH